MSDEASRPMRRWRWQRATPVAAAAASFVLLVAVLPSLPTRNPGAASAVRGPQASGQGTGAASSGPSAGPTQGASLPGTGQTGPGAAAQGPGSAAGAGTAGAAAAAAAGTASGCGNGGATYQGVTCTDIVTVFHWAQDYNEGPGDQNLAPWLAALGVSADPR